MRSNIFAHRHKVKVGETEIRASDWTLNVNRDFMYADVFDPDKPAPYLTGIRDIHGTFAGRMTDWPDDLGVSDGPVEIYLYGPARLPWYKAWWVRFREQEWPEEVIAQGPAYHDVTTYRFGDDDVRITGTFRSSGNWTIPVTHDPSWGGYWQRFRMRFFLWRHR
jgi:hypothetical protein